MQDLVLYMKVVNKIKEMIQKEVLKPGDILQSENELAKEFKTSRTTVRKGMSILLSEGYITSIPGKGYFVREPDIDKYTLFFNEQLCIENNNGQPKLLKVDLTNPTPEIAHHLKLKRTNKVILIQWLHFAEDKPVAHDCKYFPYHRGEPIVEGEINYATLPEMFAKHTSLFAINKTLTLRGINSAKLSPEVKKSLQIENDYPLVTVEQKLFDQKQNPIGLGLLFIRYDYFRLEAYSSYINNLKYPEVKNV